MTTRRRIVSKSQPSRVGEFARWPDNRRSLTGQASEGWLANGSSLTGPGERFVGSPTGARSRVRQAKVAGLPSEAHKVVGKQQGVRLRGFAATAGQPSSLIMSE